MIDFYKRAFGAKELYRMPAGDKVAHAEMELRGFIFMLADESPHSLSKAPKPGEPPHVGFMIYVEDVDKTFAHAIECGGKIERPVENQFYGDRSGTLIDPSGHQWTLATHVEDVSPEEMNRRMAKMANK
jgi:PhnB protein